MQLWHWAQGAEKNSSGSAGAAALHHTSSLTLCFHPKLKHGLGRAEDTLTVGALVVHVVHARCVSEQLNTHFWCGTDV